MHHLAATHRRRHPPPGFLPPPPVTTPAAAPSPPPPPALHTQSPPAPPDITRAHRRASERPGDEQSVGALGRVLHAWEQWGAAHDTYVRAHALAPRTFDWPYLDAVVLQRLGQPAAAVARLHEALAIDPGY